MTTSTVTAWEEAEIERANASGLTPVVFVHGLWLLSSSWQRWRAWQKRNETDLILQTSFAARVGLR